MEPPVGIIYTCRGFLLSNSFYNVTFTAPSSYEKGNNSQTLVFRDGWYGNTIYCFISRITGAIWRSVLCGTGRNQISSPYKDKFALRLSGKPLGKAQTLELWFLQPSKEAACSQVPFLGLHQSGELSGELFLPLMRPFLVQPVSLLLQFFPLQICPEFPGFQEFFPECSCLNLLSSDNVAQWVKGLASNPNDLSLVLRSMWWKENQLLDVVLCLPHSVSVDMCVCVSHTHKKIHVKIDLSLLCSGGSIWSYLKPYQNNW